MHEALEAMSDEEKKQLNDQFYGLYESEPELLASMGLGDPSKLNLL
jgi:hypothetical protein